MLNKMDFGKSCLDVDTRSAPNRVIITLQKYREKCTAGLGERGEREPHWLS